MSLYLDLLHCDTAMETYQHFSSGKVNNPTQPFKWQMFM